MSHADISDAFARVLLAVDTISVTVELPVTISCPQFGEAAGEAETQFGAVKCTSKTSSPPLCPQKTTLYKSKHLRMSKSNKKTIKQIKVKVTSNYLFWQQDY